jgi:hypothetical protein
LLSTHITSFSKDAKPADVTNPTGPAPITPSLVIFPSENIYLDVQFDLLILLIQTIFSN